MEQVKNDVDVLVIGGGTAGTIAAVQSARLGQQTALIESGSQLGGVTTTGGVSFSATSFMENNASALPR